MTPQPVRIAGTVLAAKQHQPGAKAMSDRPIQQEADPEIDLPPPAWVPPSMRVTKEQLAAAERTLDYHVRKLQKLVTDGLRPGETGRAATTEP
jgi:hypothetical protein